MKKVKRGTKQIVRDKVYGRFWLGKETDGKETRQSVPMPAVKVGDEKAIADRCDLIADVVHRLINAGLRHRARDFAILLGEETNAKRLERVLKQIDRLIEGNIVSAAGTTVKQFGDRWTSGDLHREFPRHVKLKATAEEDGQMLRKYVYPEIGGTPVAHVTLDDAERVMAKLPAELSTARARHVAQAMHRMFNLAVYPARLIKVNPLPKGFLPKLGAGKAKQYLYPDEDAKLLGCTEVPLAERVLYGVTDREGFRFLEAVRLEWDDLDLHRGAVNLDKNKTDDPRAWALDPGVVEALRKWKLLTPGSKGPFDTIPVDEHQADRFRFDVQVAGIDRTSLFDRSAESMRLRFHDLRATFVTSALALGKSETWVSDRTGHKSSAMIAKYKRAARTYAELNLGPLKPLVDAIAWTQTATCQTSVQRGRYVRKTKVSRKPRKSAAVPKEGLEPSCPFGRRILSPPRGAKGSPQAEENTGRRAKAGRPGGPFDRGLTDLGEIDRHWDSYEVLIASMDPGGES